MFANGSAVNFDSVEVDMGNPFRSIRLLFSRKDNSMAFNLKKDQRHEFQAKAGVNTVVGIDAPATTLSAAYYNGQNLTLSGTGTVAFSPIVGTYILTLIVMPAVPPEAWSVVELDGVNKQDLEDEDSHLQSTNLFIVGN